MEGINAMNISKIDYKDLAERVVATFFQAVGGTLGTNSIVDLSLIHI